MDSKHGQLRIEVRQHPEQQTGFSTIWLKRVDAVDLSRHCIYCLVGPKHRGVQSHGSRRPYVLEVEIGPGVWYLCGVTYPYVWKLNAHLPLLCAPEDGEYGTQVHEVPGMTVTSTACVRIPFDRSDVDPADPHAGDWKYSTCRNWQFAHRLRRQGWPDQSQAELKLPPQGSRRRTA